MSQIKVELQDWLGKDRSVANAAWTSSLDYQKKQTRTDDDVVRVVKMLADLKHSTPFEFVVMMFWIRMPIAADRQYMTHRLQSTSGMSGRYRTMPDEWLAVPDDVDEIACKVNYDRQVEYNQLCGAANVWYRDAIKEAKESEKAGDITNKEFKRLREFYRGVLPQHNMTERVTLINLRSWSNFIKLRNSEHAQPEIRMVAQLMLEEVKKSNFIPVAIEWLEKNGWNI